MEQITFNKAFQNSWYYGRMRESPYLIRSLVTLTSWGAPWAPPPEPAKWRPFEEFIQTREPGHHTAFKSPMVRG